MRKMDVRAAALGAALLGIGIGLAEIEPAPAAQAQAAVSATNAPSSAPESDPRRSQVLATFEGGQITVGDLEDAIAAKTPHEREQLRHDRDEQVELVNDMIEYDLLALEAARRGYGDHPLVRHRTHQVMVDALTRNKLAVAPEDVPEAEVVALYEARYDELHSPEQRRASVIVVDTKDEAKTLIEKLQGASRVRFQAAARKHNSDPALRAQAGELGYFDAQGRRAAKGAEWEVPKPFVREAFRMEHGAISDAPFAYEGGHALLFVTGLRRSMHKELSDVEAELRAELAEKAQVEAAEELAERLYEAHAKPRNLDLLRAIELEPGPRGGIPQGVPIAPPDPRAPPIAVEPDGV